MVWMERFSFMVRISFNSRAKVTGTVRPKKILSTEMDRVFQITWTESFMVKISRKLSSPTQSEP
ncbi:hypothetical protein D3C75_1109840 [compost metagenome]